MGDLIKFWWQKLDRGKSNWYGRTERWYCLLGTWRRGSAYKKQAEPTHFLEAPIVQRWDWGTELKMHWFKVCMLKSWVPGSPALHYAASHRPYALKLLKRNWMWPGVRFSTNWKHLGMEWVIEQKMGIICTLNCGLQPPTSSVTHTLAPECWSQWLLWLFIRERN